MLRDIKRLVSAIIGVFLIGTSLSTLGTDQSDLWSILLSIILGGVMLYFATTGRSIGFGRRDDSN